MWQRAFIPNIIILSFTVWAMGCTENSPAPQASSAATAAATGDGDIVITGQLAVSNISDTVKGESGLPLGQREVKIVDGSGNAVATTQTASDGSYVTAVPGSLILNSPTLALAGSGLRVESVIANTADKSVIGIQQALEPEKASGRVLSLGRMELAKITAIRGQVTLEGARDHTGIAVYVPGTSYAARTDAAGMFLMSFIPAGSYKLRFEKDGFTSVDAPEVVVTEANTSILPAAALRIGAGTGYFSVRQTGTEGLSTTRRVTFTIAAGNADRFRAGTPDEVQSLPYVAAPSSFSYTFDSDGEKQLVMIFATADGFESQITKTITVDTVLPSATQVRLADPANLNTAYTRSPQVLPYHATCEDIDAVAIVAHGTAPKDTDFVNRCYTGATNSEALPRVPSGTSSFAYDIWVRDTVGNVSTAAYSGTINYDSDPPTVATFTVADSSSGSTAASNDLTVLVTVSNCVAAGIDKIVISESQTTPPAANQFVTACTGSHSYRFANDIEEIKRVFVWGIDAAGNVATSAQSQVILVDTSRPAAPAFTIADPTPASPSASPPESNTTSLTASGIVCSGLTDILVADGRASSPTETDASWVPCVSSLSPVTASAAGLRTIYLWSKDVAGNISLASSSRTVQVRLTPTAAPSLQLIDPNTGSSTLSNATTVNVTLGSCESYSKVYFATTSTPAPAEADFVTNCATTGLQTTFAAGNGSRTVYVWYRDPAGNPSSAPASASITLDQTPPTLSSLSLAISDQSTASATYTNSQTINYAVSNCPAGNFYNVAEGTSMPSAFAGTWVDCASPSGTFSLSSGNSTKTVSVWVKDTAGNINGSSATATIILDATAPSPPGMSLSDSTGASDSGYTQSLSAYATLPTGSCDDLSFILINTTNSTPTESSGSWQACSTSANAFSVTLANASPGTKTAYIWGKDSAGNVSNSSSSASIYYDTSAPVVSNVMVTAITTTSFKVEWDTDEAATSKVLLGTSTGTYSLTPYNATSDRLTHHTADITGLTPKTKYFYKVSSADRARLTVTDTTEYSAQTLNITPFYHTTNMTRMGGYSSSFNNIEKKPMVACDLNADGRDDLVVAAPDATVGSNAAAGSVYIFLGVVSPSAAYIAPTDANISYVRNTASRYLGSQVRCLDFNGDGIKDLFISEQGSTNVAYIVFGSGSITTGLAQDITTARNVQIAPASNMSSFTSIATGNFRGPTDTYDDVVLCNAGAKECQIYFGAASPTVSQTAAGAIWKCGDCSSSNFGSGAFAGDFNGDGLLDLAVADYYSHGEDGLSSYAGGFFIRKGGSIPSSGTQTVTMATQTNFDYAVYGPASANITMGWAGDIDGDGYDDILMRNWDTGQNPVYIVFGRPASGVAGTSPPNDWADDPYISLTSSSLRISGVGTGQSDAGKWASGMVHMADVDLDNKKDLLIANPNASNFNGEACLFVGRSQAAWAALGPEITFSKANACFQGPDSNNYFGTSVAIGNFNGAADLKKELFIGAMGGRGSADLGGSNGEVVVIDLEFQANWPTTGPINYNLAPILSHP